MAIIKQYHKDTDTTYVYESTSYWDAEKGQSRSKRRVIGKIDPNTGEIIPTGRRGRSKKEPTADAALLPNDSSGSKDQETIRQQQITISTLTAKISALEEENRKLLSVVKKAIRLGEQLQDLSSGITKE
jgi:hypothetical protein